jgi:hypothetical protein
MVKETEEKVQRIIHNLKEAQARQKNYADKRRIPLYFQVGDYVYLKVSPMKGVSRFRVKGKLSPRYIGPFPVLEQCGPVAYRLQLPETLSAVHNVFHVSQLKKCLRVPDQTIEVTDVALESDLTYSEHPIRVLDQKDRTTCWGEGEDATLRSRPSQSSLHQRRQDNGQTYPSPHTPLDEDL